MEFWCISFSSITPAVPVSCYSEPSINPEHDLWQPCSSNTLQVRSMRMSCFFAILDLHTTLHTTTTLTLYWCRMNVHYHRCVRPHFVRSSFLYLCLLFSSILFSSVPRLLYPSASLLIMLFFLFLVFNNILPLLPFGPFPFSSTFFSKPFSSHSSSTFSVSPFSHSPLIPPYFFFSVQPKCKN